MTRLTLDQIARGNDDNNNNGDVTSATSLSLSHRALSDVSCLGNFKSLERLDLSFNCLTSLQSLSSCVTLKWLSVVENKLETLKGIEGLSNLTVFNAGKNKLRSIDEISCVTNLRALILNDNNISSICKLDQLKYLNTLVLSHNPIDDVGNSLMKTKSITKLSLSHCQLQTLGASLHSCVDLKEARFAHNKITTIPKELVRNAGIQILDVGNNLIENWSDLQVLSALHNLKNLNLHGNPIAENDKLAKKVKKLVPHLRILNGRPMEKSNRVEKTSGQRTLFPTMDDNPPKSAIEAKAEKAVKEKRSKTDDKASWNNISKGSTEEDHVVHSSVNVEVQKEKKRKKSKSSGKDLEEDLPIPVDGISNTKKSTNKQTKHDESTKIQDVDDVETPFMDLIANQTHQDSGKDKSKKCQQVSHDAKLHGGLVIEHTKKKKAAKTMGAGLSALQLLSTNSEVGTGGPSTWDD